MRRLVGTAIVILCAGIWGFDRTIQAQSYKVLVNFNNKPSGPVPYGNIAQSRGGSLCSSAPDMATDSLGVAFRVKTSGALTVLHEFETAEGVSPSGGLTLGRNGRFYGANEFGGQFGRGTIFEMTPDGIVKILHEFSGGAQGSYPKAAPIQGMDGVFYGMTAGDGNTIPGSVYSFTKEGDFATLHVFTGPDGSEPIGPLVQGTNFWFYGTTFGGGRSGRGTIFRINHSGRFEVLFNFDGFNGGDPYAGLIQASDGNFYGVTSRGGSSDQGVMFKMTPSHQVTIIHGFGGGGDGGYPESGLIEATDGYLYGTDVGGGGFGVGVLFRSTMAGEVTGIHDFDFSTGDIPNGLIQHTTGFLYGHTNSGGHYGHGVFYRFDLGLGPFVTFLASYGRVGMTVQILGEGFTADSQVLFNGEPAEVTEVEPTFMRAVVPDGATSGLITVTTTKGTLKSNKVFVVRP